VILRFRTAVRVMPALWFGPAIVILAALYSTSLPPADGYALAASAAGSAALPFIAAYVCASAAWEGTRLQRARIWLGPWSRSDWSIAAPAVLTPALFGILAVLAAVGLQLVRSGAADPDLRVVGVAGIDVLAWTLFGFAFGVTLPRAAAIPIALLVPFAWLGFVPAIHPVWLRHLTGMYRDCCASNEDLASSAVTASVLVDAAFIATAWLIARTRPAQRRSRALIGAGVALAAIFAASSLVSGLGFAPSVARDPSSLVCTAAGDPGLCIWPEHADRLSELVGATSETIAGWRRAGITAPRLVTEAHPGTAPPGSLAASFTDVHSRDAAILALARAVLPVQPSCPGPEAGVASATMGSSVQPFLEAWLASAGGLSSEAFGAIYGQVEALDGLSPADVVVRLGSASPGARARWLSKVSAALTSCDPVDPDVTVGP
jgi:hypothetical protein